MATLFVAASYTTPRDTTRFDAQQGAKIGNEKLCVCTLVSTGRLPFCNKFFGVHEPPNIMVLHSERRLIKADLIFAAMTVWRGSGVSA